MLKDNWSYSRNKGMKVIILAGGKGSRLWPLSREKLPKQFVKLQEGGDSLFQKTFKRSLMLTSIENIYVVGNESYRYTILGAIEEMGYHFDIEHLLTEDEGKNTLPAISLGVYMGTKGSEDFFLVLPSDHLIEDEEFFIEKVLHNIGLGKEYLVTFGMKATSPHKGYGYISKGASLEGGFRVEAFHEKPERKKAEEYLQQGYLWNGGMFLFHSSIFKEELKIHEAEIYETFEKEKNPRKAFIKVKKKISMDHGLMEKSRRVAVIPMDVGWRDLGSFSALYDLYPKDERGNTSNGDHILIKSRNNMLHSEKGKLIATVGIEDLIIIDQGDALLICHRHETEEVKEVVDTLKRRGDDRVKYHKWDYRPWGYYRIIEEEKDTFRMKRIMLYPKRGISYQMHQYRSEHWIVLRGNGKVTLDGEIRSIKKGESVFVKPGVKHRLENPFEDPLEIVEVQMGCPIDEEDIVRFQDEYGRD